MLTGQKLKKLREEKNVTLEQLAQLLDVPIGCLKDVEQGKRELDVPLIKSISEVIGVSEDYFGIKTIKPMDQPVDQLAYLSGSVGRKIRQLREERGLTLVDLGRKAGISYTHISEIERGNTCPSLKTISKLANVLGLSVTYFFTEKNGQPSQDQVTTQEKPAVKAKSIVENIKELSQGELEFLGGFLSLLNNLKTEGLMIEDAISLELNHIVRQLNKEQKEAVLDYAKFLKSKDQESVGS